MGPKIYKHNDKRLMQMMAHMIETDPVNGERDPDIKALSKMNLFYMKKKKR